MRNNLIVVIAHELYAKVLAQTPEFIGPKQNIVGMHIVSLLLTLLVVPSFYEIIDDIRLWFRRVLKMDGKQISTMQEAQSSVGDAEPTTKNKGCESGSGVNP